MSNSEDPDEHQVLHYLLRQIDLQMKKHNICFEILTCSPLISKPCLKRPLKKKTKIGFQDQLSLNAGQKLGEHSAILSTFIKLPFAIKTFFVLNDRLRQVLLYTQ